jgi:polysaccharide export outer membrane protein
MHAHRSFPVLLLRLAVMACAGAMLYFSVGALHAAPVPAAASTPTSVAVPALRTPGADDGYRLGPGDKLRVIVFGENDLSGAYEVDGNGYIRIPLIGQVQAQGDTAQKLGTVIADMLSQGYLKEPHVSVEVTTYRPFYIIGAVAKPGEYPYVSHMNALNAVALAGGFTLQAKDSVVYVRHEGSTAEHRMPADESTIIRPGDVVRVEMTPFWDVMSLISPLTGFAAIAATRP